MDVQPQQQQPFDPTVPLDYKKLGGEKPAATPSQYSWLTTLLIRCYNATPLSKIISFLHTHLAQWYTAVIGTILHTPARLWSMLNPVQAFRRIFQLDEKESIPFFRQLRPILLKIFTFPQYFAYNFPSTTALAFASCLAYLVLFDYETDLKHIPFFPIKDPTTPLGAAIRAGRKVRRALGGRTFLQYQATKLELGETTPTKQTFVDHYGPFVDEAEWNQHYWYRDEQQNHIIYSSTRGLTEEDLEAEMKFLRHKQRLALLDERFRQQELMAERRIAVKDQIYNDTNWDLRDGSIIPPGQEALVNSIYKPYAFIPEDEEVENPIPHGPGSGSLGNTIDILAVEPFFDPDVEDDARLTNWGEFTHDLTDLNTSSYEPTLDKSKLRPHRNSNTEVDPWDMLGGALLRTVGGRQSPKDADVKAIAGISAEKKKHLLGVYDGDGRFDSATKYHLKQRKLLKDEMRDHHERLQKRNKPGREVDQEYGGGFDPSDTAYQDDVYDFD